MQPMPNPPWCCGAALVSFLLPGSNTLATQQLMGEESLFPLSSSRVWFITVGKARQTLQTTIYIAPTVLSKKKGGVHVLLTDWRLACAQLNFFFLIWFRSPCLRKSANHVNQLGFPTSMKFRHSSINMPQANSVQTVLMITLPR